MAPEWRTASLRRRLAAALMLTDAPWALSRDRATGRREFYLGAAGTLFICWPVLVTAGVLAGGWVGGLPVAALLAPLTIGAVVAPQLRRRPVAAAVATASVCAVVTWQLPAGVSLTLASAAGAAAGLVAERLS
jgi:predicted branched-subunit amino acid permease